MNSAWTMNASKKLKPVGDLGPNKLYHSIANPTSFDTLGWQKSQWSFTQIEYATLYYH
jgi:hypothetical protein